MFSHLYLRENIFFLHVSYVPVIGGEQKTKPTQHGVKEVRSLGLSPDIIVCRCPQPLEDSTRKKIAAFCHVSPNGVFSAHDVPNIYHVPLLLSEQGIHHIIKERLGFTHMAAAPDLRVWKAMADTVDTASRTVQIALVGKYTGLHDSYLSVTKGYASVYFS